MWESIGLIGRDRLLAREIFPRAQGKKAPFLLTGRRGVGKSAVLQWAYEHAKEPKAYVSASWTVKEMFIEICKGWQLSIERGGKRVSSEHATLAILERAINSASKGSIFIDDIHNATPALLRRLKLWRERFSVFMAGVPPFTREELKRNLWGLEEIGLIPLAEADRRKLAELVCQHVGSDKLPSEIAIASRGYPGRIVAMAIGTVEQTAPRVKGEEIDLAPLLLLGCAAIVAVRYISIGLGEIDLYILSGIGMGLLVFFRFYLWQGMRE